MQKSTATRAGLKRDMADQVLDNIWDILVCAYCGGELQKSSGGAFCSNCSVEYNCTEHGSLDLRLRRPKACTLEFNLASPLLPQDGFKFEPLAFNDKREIDVANADVPWHLSKELMSYFPKAKSGNSLVLDLGCGDAIHRKACEKAGFQWVGLDYASTKAPIQGDAHALPFKSDAFEFILSIAVLEHIQFPFVMMQEAYRVLKPGGRFIGTVAFLEPFHGDSFYHHTHLGTFNSLQSAGFEIQKVSPSASWSGLTAQARMGLFPKMPALMSRAIVWPVEVLHKLWWQAGSLVTSRADKNVRVRDTTGAFTFVATK